jgi:ferric-dicitrate binding protein FerR (iron transport regulator)
MRRDEKSMAVIAGHRAFVAIVGVFALMSVLAFAPTSHAQSSDGYDGPQSDDIRQTVVRVAYFSGDVSYSRGDDPNNWQPASLNFPMTLGDRLYTAKGSRLELQTEDGAIYMAPETDLAVLNLTYDVKQFSLGIGSASFRIRSIDSGESFEVDTPNSAVTFDRPGEYRIDVDGNGNTRVIVNRGYAYVAAGGGEMPLEAGRMMSIEGIDSPVYDVASLPSRDSWDQWVDSRSLRFRDTGRYVNPNISGIDDLNEYGRWSEISGYGTVWSPSDVSADWQPYSAGRWAWQDPWGWSWISNEPWGWAPYHYGRWISSRSRWYWVPVGPGGRTVRYAPALVAFVGGPGFSISVSLGKRGSGDENGYVGWFPLGPRDPLVPWWGSGARSTNVANVTYMNRAYATVVDRNTFTSGAPVGTNRIRDARTLREISAAPVVRGPLQVVPLADSIRVSTNRAGSALRPPDAALNRVVVTRIPPPPAPALFREKVNLIRENRGMPVTPVEAQRFQVKNRTIRPTRSVVVQEGRVTLAPKNARAMGPAPVLVTSDIPPGRARKLDGGQQQAEGTLQQQPNARGQQADEKPKNKKEKH